MTVEITEIDGGLIADGKRAADEGRSAWERGEKKSACPYSDAYLKLQWERAWCTANYFGSLESDT